MFMTIKIATIGKYGVNGGSLDLNILIKVPKMQGTLISQSEYTLSIGICFPKGKQFGVQEAGMRGSISDLDVEIMTRTFSPTSNWCEGVFRY